MIQLYQYPIPILNQNYGKVFCLFRKDFHQKEKYTPLPCSDFFKICSSHSKVHKIIFPAAYICLNGTKALLNTKNTIEKGSVLVSWSISVIFGELRTTFVDILCLEKWIKNWCLSFLSILDHFSVKDFNLEIFFKGIFGKIMSFGHTVYTTDLTHKFFHFCKCRMFLDFVWKYMSK